MNSNLINAHKIRQFGIVAVVLFGSLSAAGFYTGSLIPGFFFGFLALLGVGFTAAPRPFSPVYSVWLKVAGFLGKVVNVVILSLAYYLVITPFALVIRIFKGSRLPLKPDKNASSYWVSRTEPAQPRERFLKRF